MPTEKEDPEILIIYNSLFVIVMISLLLLYCTYYNNIGLPLDTTDEEFIEMMSKYGIIMQDPDTGLVSFSFIFLLYFLLYVKFAFSVKFRFKLSRDQPRPV